MIRRRFILILAVAFVALFAGCNDAASDADAEPEEAATESTEEGTAIPVENAFYFEHVDGHGKETDMVAFVLFEYEQLRTVKYQVAYLSCTCRSAEVNYWSVAYVELNKSDGSIAHISYDRDTEDHYHAGLYGDSEESWDGTPVEDLFGVYIEETIAGASQESINAIEPMHGDVDAYTGATVTPNNAIRMLQGLFEYHNERYPA